MTTIPCKQPRVPTIHDAHNDVSGAHCQVPGCSWKYGPGVKTDVEQQAVRHRQAHRAAVPTIVRTTVMHDGRKVDQCQHCGWVTPVGFSTTADRARQTEAHLVEHHGLVSC